MKKNIMSMLLCLCMVMSLFTWEPVLAGTEVTEGTWERTGNANTSPNTIGKGEIGFNYSYYKEDQLENKFLKITLPTTEGYYTYGTAKRVMNQNNPAVYGTAVEQIKSDVAALPSDTSWNWALKKCTEDEKKAMLNGEEYTLILNNAEIFYSGEKDVLLFWVNMNLELRGMNVIYAPGAGTAMSGNSSSKGDIECNLSIVGNGSLKITANVRGLNTGGKITIADNAMIYAAAKIGKAGLDVYGITSYESSIEIKENAHVIAEGITGAISAATGSAIVSGEWYQWAAGNTASNYYKSSKTEKLSGLNISQNNKYVEIRPIKGIYLKDSNNNDLKLGITHSFALKKGDAASQSKQTFTIVNQSDSAVSGLSVTLSGENADKFQLEGTVNGISIENDRYETFSILPVSDLAVGNYRATVSVTGSSITCQAFDVALTVEEPTPSPTPTSTPSPTPSPTPTPTSTPTQVPFYTPDEVRAGTVTTKVVTEKEIDGAQIISSENEMKDSVFTLEDNARIQNGEDAEIFLEVSDISKTVKEEEKIKIEHKLHEEFGEGVQSLYLDITLYKKIGNHEPSVVTKPKNKIQISIKVPDNMILKDGIVARTYKIVRFHEDKVDIIEGIYDPLTKLFTFETDQFSIYVLTYKDSQKKLAWAEVYDTMTIGEKMTFSYEAAGIQTDEIVWMTTRRNIAVVGKNKGKSEAVVTAKSAGTDVLYLKSSDGTLLKMTIKVEEQKSIQWKETFTAMTIGEQKVFSFEAQGYQAAYFAWNTNKRNIAVVGKNRGKLEAVVTAKSKGTDVLYVRYGKNKVITFKIKVTEK